jgi:hypothetical protein
MEGNKSETQETQEQPAVEVEPSSTTQDNVSSNEQEKNSLPQDNDVGLSEEEIRNPYAMAKAYYEFNTRLKQKLVEAEQIKAEYEAHKLQAANKLESAKKALAERLAMQALKEAGITDSDLVELTKEKVLKEIVIGDDFAVADSNYRQMAHKLAEKIGAKTQPVFLGAPSQKEEEPPKDWRELLAYRIKRM